MPAGETVAGLAVASLGEACALLDAAGRPLGNIIAWFDRRSEEDAQRIPAERLFRITGLAPDPTYTVCKLLWTRRTTPALFARARRMLNVADWIAFRLSGEAATDFSLASRTACLDLGRRCWSVEFLREADIDIGLLPAIHPSGTALGQVRPDVLRATGLPGRPVIGVGAHDHICGWFAAGAMDEGVLLDSMGTAESILTAVRQPVTVQDIVRQGYAQGAIGCDEPRFYLGGTINSSGGAVEWFRRLFAGDVAHQNLIEEAGSSPPGSNGMCFVPHLAGAGPPFADMPACGALLGVTASTGRGDAFRAVLEGLALEARSVRDAMTVLPGVAAPRSVLVIGGHVRNRLLLEIKASVYRQELRVIAEPEATAFGAALLGGIAAGLCPGNWLTELNASISSVRPRILARVRRPPVRQHASSRPVDLDLERIAFSGIAGVAGSAIAARARGKRAEQIDIGEELEEVARTNRARLHEISVRVTGKTGAHEHVQHVVDVHLGFMKRKLALRRKRARQVGVAAVVVFGPPEQEIGVGVAARANDVVNTGSVLIPAVPIQCVMGDGRHGAEARQRAPEPVAGGEVRCMEGPGLAAVKAFPQVVRIP
ncbi:MAG: hypothetical protein JO122_08370 [Acetobacteraceae bacterium]|nr:hypothetical protein [Acetobacteraceae bacterium]